MSLETRYQNHSQETVDLIQNLDELDSIATAAGHGYSQLGLTFNAGWVEVEIDPENTRPRYDMSHIRTFSPDTMQALIYELSESRKRLAELGESITVPVR